MAEQPPFVTIYNPVNGLPWECPNNPDALALWVDEKGYTKGPNDKTPTEHRPAGSSSPSGNPTKADLLAQAEARGISVPGGATKADIEQLLAEGSEA